MVAPAFAQAPVSAERAVSVFMANCFKTRGNHAATLASIKSARGFSVTATGGGQGITERVMSQHGSESMDLSAMKYGGADLCFVGFTPSGDRKAAQAETVAKLAAALGVSPSDFRKKGKELRLSTSQGTIKVVLNRVYPVSINMSSK